MALIQCSECGNQVSDRAEACPKCGNPIAKTIVAPLPIPAAPQKKKSGFFAKVAKTVGAIFVGFIVIAIYIASQAPSTPKPSPGYSATSPEPEPLTTSNQAAAISVQASDLYAAYDANEVSADQKYKGTRMNITGTVVEVSKDFMDDPYVQLLGKNKYATVRVSFAKSRLNELAKLSKGDNITVSGCIGKGMIIMSPIVDCR